MIKFLTGKSTSHDISIKILELLKEIEKVRLLPSDSILKKSVVKDYFDRKNKEFQAFKDRLLDTIKKFADRIKDNLEQNYFTKAESDQRYHVKKDDTDFVKSGEINNFLKEFVLDTNKTLLLNNTSGPLITTPDFSLEVRPNLIKIKNSAGKDLFVLENGSLRINGNRTFTDIEELNSREWKLLEGTRNRPYTSNIDLSNLNYTDLMIVIQYAGSIFEPEFRFLKHIPYYKYVGNCSIWEEAAFKLFIENNELRLTVDGDRSDAYYYGVYYR